MIFRKTSHNPPSYEAYVKWHIARTRTGGFMIAIDEVALCGAVIKGDNLPVDAINDLKDFIRADADYLPEQFAADALVEARECARCDE